MCDNKARLDEPAEQQGNRQDVHPAEIARRGSRAHEPERPAQEHPRLLPLSLQVLLQRQGEVGPASGLERAAQGKIDDRQHRGQHNQRQGQVVGHPQGEPHTEQEQVTGGPLARKRRQQACHGNQRDQVAEEGRDECALQVAAGEPAEQGDQQQIHPARPYLAHHQGLAGRPGSLHEPLAIVPAGDRVKRQHAPKCEQRRAARGDPRPEPPHRFDDRQVNRAHELQRHPLEEPYRPLGHQVTEEEHNDDPCRRQNDRQRAEEAAGSHLRSSRLPPKYASMLSSDSG